MKKKMMMHRPLAASCAACLVTAVLYPLEVSRTARQLGRPIPAWNTRNITSGGLPAIADAFATTHAFFTTYEALRAGLGAVPHVALSSAGAIAVSTLVHTPFDVVKKHAQFRAHGLVDRSGVARVGPRMLLQLYALHVARNGPKTIVKYMMYEAALARLLPMRALSSGAAGFVAAALAAAVTTIVCTPLDVLKIRTLTHATPRWFSGMRVSAAYSVLSNAIGHGLLETWSPRPA